MLKVFIENLKVILKILKFLENFYKNVFENKRKFEFSSDITSYC